MEKSETIRTATYSDIWVDEFRNVRQSTDFENVLGRITEEFRFIPQGIVVEQGLTPEMLDIIAKLTRQLAGIGVKKAEPLKDDA
jgi:hypothetical protein